MGEAPSAEWRSAPFLARKAATAFLRALFAPWGFKVTGLEHVPPSGPVILAGNHVANADGPLVAAAVRGRRWARGLGKREVFEVPILGRFLLAGGNIPLDRGQGGDVGALRAALAVLKAGGCLIVMPEGTRSKTGQRLAAKGGLGFLAASTGALVVPAHILGSDRWPGPARLEVRFGAGMRFEGAPSDRQACRAFGEAVLDRVFSL